jgi:hypothetical protein
VKPRTSSSCRRLLDVVLQSTHSRQPGRSKNVTDITRNVLERAVPFLTVRISRPLIHVDQAAFHANRKDLAPDYPRNANSLDRFNSAKAKEQLGHQRIFTYFPNFSAVTTCSIRFNRGHREEDLSRVQPRPRTQDGGQGRVSCVKEYLT